MFQFRPRLLKNRVLVKDAARPRRGLLLAIERQEDRGGVHAGHAWNFSSWKSYRRSNLTVVVNTFTRTSSVLRTAFAYHERPFLYR